MIWLFVRSVWMLLVIYAVIGTVEWWGDWKCWGCAFASGLFSVLFVASMTGVSQKPARDTDWGQR